MDPDYMQALTLIDFYKVGHISQYPAGTKQVWSNWVPRSSRVPQAKGMIFFGLQYYMMRYLQDNWRETFFDKPWRHIEGSYKKLIKATLGVENPKIDHIKALHDLRYLPIEIYALPEGSLVDLRVPCFVITNTNPDFYWLPNYLETSLSNILWKACTSATTARQFREIFMKHAKEAGETDFSFVDWQGHDFSFRGMSGVEDVVLSGMGHLLSFSGTDTIPAILAAAQYYSADLTCGGSVSATEHAVMCAGGQENEFETFRRLIEDIYPTGIVSIVSDTWDLWKVLTDYLPRLRDSISARDGKVVIRPDSGDPVDILCGEASASSIISPKSQGVLRLLRNAMGVTYDKSHSPPSLNKVGAIYGDAISLDRADRILDRCIHEIGLSPYSVVFGIGSYTYEYVTRDTYGMAMKATAVRTADGSIKSIFKKPVTDDGVKNSLKGIPAVYQTEHSTEDSPSFFVVEEATEQQLANCAFVKVFEDGKILKYYTFDEIRKKVRA
jgi:nicotinamide phosphoribosyltransferase